MSVVRTAAEREEEAELSELRDEAARTAAEAARTLAELSRRIEFARRPKEAAARLAADARVTALRAVRRGWGRTGGRRGAWRPALAAVLILAAATGSGYLAARTKRLNTKRRSR